MKESTLVSLTAAAILSCPDDVNQRAQLLLRIAQIFGLKPTRQLQLIDKCAEYQRFVLHVTAHLSATNENLLVVIFDDSSCRQKSLNSGEEYRIELGTSAKYQVKFSLTKFNGENRNAMVRSTSLLRRVMFDKKPDESIALEDVPLGVVLKKAISLKGRTHHIELKTEREDLKSEVDPIDYEDVLDLVRAAHEWQAEEEKSSSYAGVLDETSHHLMMTIARFFRIPTLVFAVAEMSSFLVWDSKNGRIEGSAIDGVCTRMASQSTSNLDGSHEMMEPCLSCLAACLRDLINEVLEGFIDEQLFPPGGAALLKNLNVALRGVVDICVLPMWDFCPSVDPSTGITSRLLKMLETSTIQWNRLLQSSAKEEYAQTVQAMWRMLSSGFQPYQIFFHQFNINYLQVVFLQIDVPLEMTTKTIIADEVKLLDSRDDEQLESFAKRTMKTFDVLRLLGSFARQRGVEGLAIDKFEEWFVDAAVFWTYSWRQITQKMVERTISLDDDGESTKYGQRRPLPAGLYSFLCIQKGLSDDYARLNFCVPQNQLMGAMALVHIFSENICIYAKKLYNEAVGTSDEKESRLVRASNGIDQATCFVEERWKRFVNFDRLRQGVLADESLQLEKSASRVLESCRQRCDELISSLVHQLCGHRHDDAARICKSLTLDSNEYSRTLSSYMREVTPAERMNAILVATDKLVDAIRGELLPNCFLAATKHLGRIFEEEIRRHLRDGQAPDYYSSIYVTVKFLYEMLGLDATAVPLLNVLHQKSFSTLELLLSYYASLSDKVEQLTTEDSPTIEVQLGYSKTSSDQLVLFINVLGLSRMRWLDPLSDRVDTFVKIELLPKALFPDKEFSICRTKPVPQSTTPVWRQHFEMTMPTQSFFTHGATLGICVMDHDRLCDRVIGRTFVPLHKIVAAPQNATPVFRLPLLSHVGNTNSVYYQLLKERSRLDSVARNFIAREGRHAQLRILPAIIHRRIISS